MRIVQTVFGVFHHFELARELELRGHLQTIYSTWPWMRLKREGLPRHRVRTFPVIHTAEMMLNRSPLRNDWLSDELGYLNALTFDEWTARQLSRAVEQR
jgi:starch synthase